MVLGAVGFAVGLLVVGTVAVGALMSQLVVYCSKHIIASPFLVSALGTVSITPFQAGLFPAAPLNESTFSLRVQMFVACSRLCRIAVRGFLELMAEIAYFGCRQD